MAIDPYVYPGTSVLKNLAGITNPTRLAQFEAFSTANRISELIFEPIPGAFDIAHLRSIHRHIFQDVYPWAGEFRAIDMRKEGEFWFCRRDFVESSLADLFARLKAEDHLKRASVQSFGNRAGYYLSELNAIHPFREGNGRA